MKSEQLTIILEKAEDGFFARIRGIPNYLPTTFGETVEQVTSNMRELLVDYIEHEGKDTDFATVDVSKIEFAYEYDLEAFFEEFSFLKITDVAKVAGLNGSLLRQYANGSKQASEKQVKKIEDAIHKIAKSLLEVQLS